MSQILIKTEKLGKKYVLAHKNGNSEGLRHVLQKMAMKPIQWLRGSGKSMVVARKHHQNGESLEDFWALRDVSLEIRQGDVVGIVGRNGAGKSTLLKILSRITEPTEGRVKIRGRMASLLEVGTGFHPELTGRENIFLNGAILGMSFKEIKRKFDEIVAFAEVEKFLDTPVKRYSSGMYVRLAFAVAAHLESEIMLVDEVLAVGDAQFQKKCMGKMQEVAANQGRTVLFVSHNAGAISALCTKGIYLKGGRFVMAGNVRDVLQVYNSAGARDSIDLRGDELKPSITSVAVDQSTLLEGDFVLEVAFASPFPLNPPTVGIVVSNSFGIPVFGSNTLMHPDGFIPKQMSKGVSRIRVGQLPLHPGEYCVSVFLGEIGSNYDIKRDVLRFNFVPKKPVVNCPPVESIGPLIVDAKWELE